MSPSRWDYIDDYNSTEKIQSEGSITHHTTKKTVRNIHASKIEALIMTVAQRAAELQMKVNKAKTQLLCICAGQDEAKAYIDTEQGRIQSSAELKILGFTFGTRPDPGTHVEKMKMKLRSRYWGMCNLGIIIIIIIIIIMGLKIQPK